MTTQTRWQPRAPFLGRPRRRTDSLDVFVDAARRFWLMRQVVQFDRQLKQVQARIVQRSAHLPPEQRLKLHDEANYLRWRRDRLLTRLASRRGS